MAHVLRDLAISDVRVFERNQIGPSFRAWPLTMGFITASFPGNAFGLADLNAISFDSSPGFSVKREHPSGAENPTYLEQAAMVFGLPMIAGVDVKGMEPDGDVESTELPGLFLIGPEVKHAGIPLCFIYEFRQRFELLARAIAGPLRADTSALSTTAPTTFSLTISVVVKPTTAFAEHFPDHHAKKIR
ncbi:NAD(P)-binding domain-containing protein [Agrobacterium sp. SORGH_AS 787]|uniref:NAD(P)-binding domain-containing protein n=1 Tax=Agrobacterium sp. SORGH_AS 787 TaxID=3041775 RepID=UPI0032B7B205